MAIIFGLALTPLMIGVGVAVDYSNMSRERLKLQQTADATALYATIKLEKAGFEKTALIEVAEHMKEANLDLDGDAGLELDKENGEVTVFLTTTYEPVVLQIMGKKVYDIKVKAVVKYSQTLGDVKCFMAMKKTGSGILSLNGNAKVIANNCDVQVNSSSPDSVDLNGLGTEITASNNCFVGGVASGASRISPPPEENCEAMPDPFVDLVTPVVGECDYTDFSETRSGYREINPGVYCGGIHIGSSTYAHFLPGLYVIKDGSFKTVGNADIFGDEVTFFFTGTDIQLDFSGGTTFDFSAMKTGELKGFVFFFDPATPTTKISQFTGGSQTRFDGVLYFADNDVDIGGDANLNTDSPLSIIIARQIKLHGNGTLYFNVDLENTDIVIPDSLYDKEITMYVAE